MLAVKRGMRGPGIEPGSTAWKATMLTITPATLHLLAHGRQPSAMAKGCILRGSNSRGLCPLGLKSSALTTRPKMHTAGKRGHAAYRPVPTYHNHQAPACSPPLPHQAIVGQEGSQGSKPVVPFYHWPHKKKQTALNKKKLLPE